MPFFTQGGIYRPKFLHENNDHPVSQALESLKLTLGSLLDQRSRFMTSSAIFADVSKNDFCSVKYTRVT